MLNSDPTKPAHKRSWIFLPRSLYVPDKRGNTLLSRIFGKRMGKAGLVAAGLTAAAVGLAVLKKPKEDEALLGEQVPDFDDDSQPEAKAKPEVEVPEPTPVRVATPKAEPAKPAEPEQPSWLSKAQKLFSKEEVPKPVEKGVTVTAPMYQSKLSSKLGGDYRGQQVFSGFDSASTLTKYGAYTNEEAAIIRKLKSSGVNTSASAGKMSEDIESRIRFFADKHGVDPNAVLKMAQMESGGNPNAISSTGAIGIFQFTGRTASEMGITNRFDIDQNIEAGVLLAKKSAGKLIELQIEPTHTNVYLMHQLGAAGAKELIQAAASNKSIASLSKTTQKAIKHNYSGSTSKSAREYIRATEEALAKRSTAERFASATVLPSTSSSETAPPVQIASVAAPVKMSVVPKTASATPVQVQVAKVDVPDVISKAPKSSPATSAVPKPSVRTAALAPVKPQSIVRTKQGVLLDVS